MYGDCVNPEKKKEKERKKERNEKDREYKTITVRTMHHNLWQARLNVTALYGMNKVL